MATSACRMTARISSSQSMSRISATSIGSASTPPPPPNMFAPVAAHEASSSCSRRANQNGAGVSAPAAPSDSSPRSSPCWRALPASSASWQRHFTNRRRRNTMAKTQIMSPKLRQPTGVFSHATAIEATGRFVFVSGMTARRPDGSIAGIGDITEQTRQVCENVKSAVEAAGGTMDDICRVDVYVRNMEHFDAIHKVRREYFKAPAPASTMVEVCKMTSPDYLIEINAIAVVE